MSLAPLYKLAAEEQRLINGAEKWQPGPNGRVPNLNPDFVSAFASRLCLSFVSDGHGDLSTTFGPEDIFHYIYAVFHSPTYRQRYAEFLKIDFPRVPDDLQPELFRKLCILGQELVALHLLESPNLSQLITRYPVAGDNIVEKGFPKFVAYEEERRATSTSTRPSTSRACQRRSGSFTWAATRSVRSGSRTGGAGSSPSTISCTIRRWWWP